MIYMGRLFYGGYSVYNTIWVFHNIVEGSSFPCLNFEIDKKPQILLLFI